MARINLEEINFVRVVEEVQKIEWPEKIKEINLEKNLADITMSDSLIPPVQMLAGLLMAEFIDQATRTVHGDNIQFESANIEIVLEEAHPDLMKGILLKIKDRVLMQVPITVWEQAGGY